MKYKDKVWFYYGQVDSNLILCYYPAMEKESSASVPETFASLMGKFEARYVEISAQYSMDEDEDLLGQNCDRLRHEYFPHALGLASSITECQQLLSRTMERNTELRAKILTKMETLKP